MADKIAPKATAHVEYVDPIPQERDVRITVIVTSLQAKNLAEYFGNSAYELWDVDQTEAYGQFGRMVYNALDSGIQEPEGIVLGKVT